MSQKRIRSINWDEEEKQLFRSVLKEYAQVIENKSLNNNTNKMKMKAWEELHRKFNELNSRPRELSQLKIQWKTMKVNARKTFSTFKKETNRTGGGARPTSPTDAVIEVKDLLNPAELLRDHNIYDSDGILISEFEIPSTSGTCTVKVQDSTAENMKQKTDTVKIDNYQMGNILSIELIEDVDTQVNSKSIQVCQDTAIEATPMGKDVDRIPVKTSDDDILQPTATPVKKTTDTNIAKKVPKRKLLASNNIKRGNKKRKDHDDYVEDIVKHSRMLKDEEHKRRMEMAEAEHAIKMDIYRQQMKNVMLEAEILEIKKRRENL